MRDVKVPRQTWPWTCTELMPIQLLDVYGIWHMRTSLPIFRNVNGSIQLRIERFSLVMRTHYEYVATVVIYLGILQVSTDSVTNSSMDVVKPESFISIAPG